MKKFTKKILLKYDNLSKKTTPIKNTTVELLTSCKNYNYNRIKKGKIMIDKQELHKIFSEMRKGNNSQFEILYKNYNQLVYKIAFSILKNKENSEDVMQTVFAKIYNLKKEQLPSSKEATWLYAVTKNETLTFLRKEKTNISLEEAYNIDTGKECEELQDIVDTEKYNKIISGLSLKEKEIVSLKIVGELSFKEIARILNEPIGTVQWRYYKALNSLKLMLGNISMFIVALTLYISSMQYKKSENIEIANETSKNSQTTEESKTEKDEISQDNKKENQFDSAQTDGKDIIENVIENNTVETIEIQPKDEKMHNITINIFLSCASIFLMLTIIFAIIFTKHQQNRSRSASK